MKRIGWVWIHIGCQLVNFAYWWICLSAKSLRFLKIEEAVKHDFHFWSAVRLKFCTAIFFAISIFLGNLAVVNDKLQMCGSGFAISLNDIFNYSHVNVIKVSRSFIFTFMNNLYAIIIIIVRPHRNRDFFQPVFSVQHLQNNYWSH